jgi:hypothetical protein
MQHAMENARNQSVSVTTLPRSLWPHPVFVFRIADRLTSTGATVRSVFAGVEVLSDGSFQALLDWQLLDRLNGVLARRALRRDEPPPRPSDYHRCRELLPTAQTFVGEISEKWDLPFRSPESNWFALIWPGE